MNSGQSIYHTEVQLKSFFIIRKNKKNGVKGK